MRYWVDGNIIRYEGELRSGFMHKDYLGQEMNEYLAWVAEGNTAEEWDPEG